MKFYVNWTSRTLANEEQFDKIVKAGMKAVLEDEAVMNGILSELYDYFGLYNEAVADVGKVTQNITEAVYNHTKQNLLWNDGWKEQEKITDANFVWVHWQNSEVFSNEEANEKIAAKVKQLYADKERFMEYLDENYEASEIFCMIHPENAEKMDNITNLKREYYTDCEIEAEEQFTQYHQKITLGTEKAEA